MSLPATIKTAVGQSLVHKVSRLFNGSLFDVLTELLQNARRAGASHVDIDTYDLAGHPTLIVRDDGSGIDDPAKLVTLGDSGWDDAIADREDPAGMGVFSLAGHRVEVRSFSASAGKGWRVVITPDAWESGSPLAIEPFEIDIGTEILIDLPESWESTLDGAVARCSLHYPIPVFLRGDAQPRTDFLAGATYLENWHGCRIGVFRGLGNRPLDCPLINFHGLTVGCDFPIVSEIDHHEPWSVKIDILDAPALQLVLPARKEMVQNEALSKLKTAAERTILRAFAARGSHRLPYKTWCRADALGVELPEAEAWLEAWEPQTADGHGIPSGDRVAGEPMVLLDSYDPDIDQSAAQVLGSGTPLGRRPVRANDAFAGYRWYDALPRVTDIAFIIDTDIGIVRYADGEVLPTDVVSGRVDEITLQVIIELPDAPGNSEWYSLPLEALVCRNDGYGNLDEAVILVSRNAAIKPGTLAWLIEASCFSYDEDHDSDSWGTQHRAFEKSARQIANEILLGEEQALLERIRDAIADEVIWLIPKGRSITLLAGDDAMTLSFLPQDTAG
ncbi:hypothetical protein GCM10009087_19030 [Sphingomonas oligophenolica]|uniref:ATP-binding protein n=1 Tax=Sphingomonas oligophenolica TaxID=301154 RepID=A0ABU9Y364_9SPHN